MHDSRSGTPGVALRRAAPFLGILALAACSLADLGSLTAGEGPEGGQPTDGEGLDGATNTDDAATNDDASDVDVDVADASDEDAMDASSKEDASDGDAGPDASVDAGGDASVDAGTDAGIDAGPVCKTTAYRGPTAAANEHVAPSDVGGRNSAWVNLTRVFVEDGVFATAGAAQSVSQILRANDFGFASELPLGATIKGVQVEIVRAPHTAFPFGTDQVSDAFVRLRLDDGTDSEGSKKIGGLWPEAVTTVSYGGADDTWGEPLTRAIVTSPDFGIVFAFSSSGQGVVQDPTGQVDAIRVRISYCE